MKFGSRSLTTPRALLVGLVVFGAGCHRNRSEPPAPAPAPAPETTRATPRTTAVTSGPTLLRAMREKYPQWYRSVTFTQRTTLVAPSGGEIHQTWYEAGELPGRLRIDSDLESKSGTLFARDSIYAFSQGKLVSAEPGLNELLVLGFDAYAESNAHVEAQLRSLGFDLAVFHEGIWQGRHVYVVGAQRGDTTSKQFWIDRDNLLFVRLLEHGRQGNVDIRFNKYEPAGAGWIATEVVQYVNGARRLLEEYSNVRTNVTLDGALFDPKHWSTVRHWSAAPRRN